MDRKNLKLLITAAILILAVCLGIDLVLSRQEAAPQDSVGDLAQDSTGTPVQALPATVPEEDRLPLDTAGSQETKPEYPTVSYDTPPVAPDETVPSTSAPEKPAETAPDETTEAPAEGTLPPNMLPIG